MPITRTIYDTNTFLGVFEDFDDLPSYWLDLAFPAQINFDTEKVNFEKITRGRKLAPFVMPLDKGKPIYSKGSRLTEFKPAYIKMTDYITPQKLIRRRPGNLLNSVALTPAQNLDAIRVDMVRMHYESHRRTQEWMAARAIIDGTALINSEDQPSVLVDFARDPAHTITLTGGARWSETTADVQGNLESWQTLMQRAQFGGPANRITGGPAAIAALRKSKYFIDNLDTQRRGSNANAVALTDGSLIQYVGNIGALDIYVNSEYYEDSVTGAAVPMMDDRDIVLTGPNIQGVRCFGAIQNLNAGFQPFEIFPSSVIEFDPGAEMIKTESAPIMVPVNPNNTLRARVLA